MNNLYTMKDLGNVGMYMEYLDWNESAGLISTDEVSVIEIPLVGVEKRIMDCFAEEMGEE